MREFRAIVHAHAAARADHEAMLLGTVVRVDGSAYRRPGARMLMAEDRWLAGAVSGGCLERHLLQRAAWHTARDRFARVTYDSTSDEDGDRGFGLGCQGIVDILLERLLPSEPLDPVAFIAGCLERRERGVLATVIGHSPNAPAALGQRLTLTVAGESHSDLGDAALAEKVELDAHQALAEGGSRGCTYALAHGAAAEVFMEVIPAPVQLFVFGGGQDVVPLAELASLLGWRTTVVVDRLGEALRQSLRRLGTEVVTSPAEQAVRGLPIDEDSLVVLMTHSYSQDRALLRDLLPSPIRYLGVMGPRRRTDQLLGELREDDRGRDWPHVHSPIGLDLGAEQPEQIALAIVAEAQAVLSGHPGTPLLQQPGPIHARWSSLPPRWSALVERGACPLEREKAAP